MRIGRRSGRRVAWGALLGTVVVGTLAVLPSTGGATPSASGCVVDPADMLGWWKGEDDLAAEVGPALSGTIAHADAMVGRGMSFDGATSGSAVGVDSLAAPTDGVSVEVWVQAEPSDQVQSLVSRWTFVGGEGDDAYALWLSGSGISWMVDDQTLRRPEQLIVADAGVADGTFHHVVATWSQSELAVYVDGALAGSTPSRGGLLNAADTTALRIGSAGGAGDPFWFDGVLDEPTVFDRALTPTEVQAIYSAGTAGKCSAAPPAVQQAALTAADGVAGDWLGRAVDIDGETAVVGASLDDGQGTVRVYTRSGTTWSPQATLVATDGKASDDFGYAVAVSGDTIVVGAYEHDVPTGSDGALLNSGAAYVYVRSGAMWTQQAKLVAATPAAHDNFGRSVDVSGDTVVVGALHDDDKGSNSGAAFVFTRSGATWTQEARLLAADGVAGDRFGASVAVTGGTVLAGAIDDDDAGASSGSAYVFDRSGSTWTQQAKLVAGDATAGSAFGWSVGIDTVGSPTTAVIGAPFDPQGGVDSGAGYVFTRSGTTWTQQAKLTASDAAAGDDLGVAVALDGDIAAVGGPGRDGTGTDRGAAYVFLRSTGSWSEQAMLTATDPADGDAFGMAVAFSGSTAVVGAPGDEDEQGAAYVFVPM